ncbi:MAG: HPF/RaiA family ribosome-associated protein [Hyphomicrobium sp.]|jgi:hypothetical protein
MQLPLQIAFDGIVQSDELESLVRDEFATLAEFAPLISIVRVVLGHPQRRYHTVNACRVHIQIGRPGAADIVITRDPAITGADAEDVATTIRDAFKALRRRLAELNEQR